MSEDRTRPVLFPGQALAGSTRPLFSNTATWVTVNATAVVNSLPIKLVEHKYFSAQVKGDSASGTADVVLTMQCRNEGSDSLWVTKNLNSSGANQAVAETLLLVDVEPPPCAEIRFVLTGQAGNPADTKVYMNIFMSD